MGYPEELLNDPRDQNTYHFIQNSHEDKGTCNMVEDTNGNSRKTNRGIIMSLMNQAVMGLLGMQSLQT